MTTDHDNAHHNTEPLPIPETQPIPPELEAARVALIAALQANPRALVALSAAEALSTINDVWPPYPPAPEAVKPWDPASAIPEALACLRGRLEQAAGEPEELARVALAAGTLRNCIDGELR